jgi:hypothetical protein
MAILAKNPVTGELTLIDSALPRNVALDLDAGAYEVLPVGDIIGSVNVLAVAFAVAPTISGTATAGATLTVSGTATAAVAYEYQWLADGVLIAGAISAAHTTDAVADLGKTFVGQMRAQDVRGRWTVWASSSNSITIPSGAAFTVADNKWTGVEATSDANTRKTTVEADCIGNTPPTGALYWYKGTNSLGNLAQVSAMTDDGDGTFSKTSTGTEALGATVYVRLAYWNASKPGGAGYDWCSSVKTYTTSNIPAAPGAFVATNSATITGTVSLDPNDTPPTTNGRAILEYGYSENGGTIVAFATGGTATTARSVAFAGTDARTVRIHARNVNGWSAGSASQTVTPPVISGGVNVTVPTLEVNLWPGGNYVINAGVWTGTPTFTYDLEVSDNGTTGWTTLAADVQPTGTVPAGAASKYIRAKETPSVGTAVYSLASAQFGTAKDHVLSVRSSAYLTQTLGAGFLGATSLTSTGIWFSACVYYDGVTSWSASQGLVSIGNGTTPGREITLAPNGLYCVDNSGSTRAIFSTPVATGWYIVTGWMRKPSSNAASAWRNDEIGAEFVTSGTYALSTNFLNMRIGSSATTPFTKYTGLIHSICWGTGNPALAHAWAYNGGDIRQMKDYDFGSDANGCTLGGHIDPSRVGSTTFDVSQIVDTVGTYDTWTASGSPSYTARRPGYIFAGGDPVPVPSAYIGPGGHGFAGETFSLQSGYFSRTAMTATAWATATSYALEARVTQGGNLYICTTAHTAGTFATDLAAEKWKIFTLNTLTHAAFPADHPFYDAAATVLGDIKPLVSNGSFVVAQPGIVTANITVGSVITAPSAWAASTSYVLNDKRQSGGKYYRCTANHTSGATFSLDLSAGLWVVIYETLNVEAHVFAARAMPATPRHATLFRNNGLIAGIEPYPTVVGTGETFANTAALQTRINALASGETLIVENLDNFDTGVALQITGKDFGGATVVARNLGGVRVDSIYFTGSTAPTQGLTIRGLEVKNGIGVNETLPAKRIRSLWLDHMRAKTLNLWGSDWSTAWVRLSNFAVWTAGENSQSMIKLFKTVVCQSSIFGGTSTTADDCLRADLNHQLIFDRVAIADCGGERVGSHPDLLQIFSSGYAGVITGMFRRTITVDGIAGPIPPQGLFLSGDGGQRFKDFRMEDFVGIAGAVRAVSFSKPLSNCYLKNGFGNNEFNTENPGGIAAAVFVENCIKGAASVFTAFPGGTEYNNYRLGNLGVVLGDVYPAYASVAGGWQQLANPAPFYDTAGPATFIADLEAKRVALGI